GLPRLRHSQVCFFRAQEALWEKLPRIFWILFPQPDLVYEETLHLQVRDGDGSARFAQPTPFPVCVQVQTRAHTCNAATPRAYTQLLRSLLSRVQLTPNPVLSWTWQADSSAFGCNATAFACCCILLTTLTVATDHPCSG
ncbi:hypothetical protein LEMLEM_LOCUS8372, partial [Lemmus lemmus]